MRQVCPLRSPRPHRAVRYRAGVAGVEFLTGGHHRILGRLDGLRPRVGWGKVGLGYCVGSALDRERASCAAGWDTKSDTDEEAASNTGCLSAYGQEIADVGLYTPHGHYQRLTA